MKLRGRLRKIALSAAVVAASIWSVAPPAPEQVESVQTVAVVSAEPDRCGLTSLWATAADDPFTPCCAIHDTEYLLPNPRPRLAVDLSFYACCVESAKGDHSERARALLFYKVVRLIGWRYYEGPQ